MASKPGLVRDCELRARAKGGAPMTLAASDAGAAMIEAARGLAGAIYAARDQIERDRQLPAPLVAMMADAGLFRMLVPREFGGSELDPASYVRVVEEISRVDGSAGWCV